MKIKGNVIPNKGRGKDLGFPTANLDYIPSIDDGIYIAKTTFNNQILPSLLFIGSAITFGENERVSEVYILDFDEDIYGKEIEVEIIEKIRDNKKFDSENELIDQMKRDEEHARAYFKKRLS